jgi:8-oxo-dGTP pyrophosphatase MutT (NUDIX family)
MNVNEIKKQLQFALSKELPGEFAHLKMAPLNRSLKPNLSEKKPRQSAVLILIDGLGETPSIVLIQRPTYQGVHSNQVALPGGKVEPEDENLLATAKRETHEEIGVTSDKYEIIGELSTIYIPPSNFYVAPFVAISNQHLIFTPEEKEVSEIIIFPISELLASTNKQEQLIKMSTGFQLKTMTYVFNHKTIWGATAMILSELEHMIKA